MQIPRIFIPLVMYRAKVFGRFLLLLLLFNDDDYDDNNEKRERERNGLNGCVAEGGGNHITLRTNVRQMATHNQLYQAIEHGTYLYVYVIKYIESFLANHGTWCGWLCRTFTKHFVVYNKIVICILSTHVRIHYTLK